LAPTLPGIELQILFDTGRDELTERSRASVLLLAELLRTYPQLLVRLEGHTDSRGTDEYNNVLSDYRARSVEDCLTGAGIAVARIERSACGSSRSRAARGDSRGYALERRVTIEVYRADKPAMPVH
jgi:outer membrane protein OmpA-like peptidoglycan-associated protein